MDFRGQVWKQVGKMTFLLWNRVRIWKTRHHTLTKNSKEYPPPHPPAKNLSISQFAHMMNYTLLGQNCAEIRLRCPQLSFLILGTPQQRGYCAILSKENQDMLNFFNNTKVECAIDCRLNCINSFKKVKRQGPNESWIGGGFCDKRSKCAWFCIF